MDIRLIFSNICFFCVCEDNIELAVERDNA